MTQIGEHNMVMANTSAEQQNGRALFGSLAPLLGPFIGFGDCLAPQFPSGCFFWVDPNRQPVVGDLVWYHWSDAWCAELRTKWGVDFTGGAKWLRLMKGQRYLESNEGAVPLTDGWIIVGPVVATLEWRHPPGNLAATIAAQDALIAAATQRMDAAGAPSPLDAREAVRS
jgi:hypothetical protein